MTIYKNAKLDTVTGDVTYTTFTIKELEEYTLEQEKIQTKIKNEEAAKAEKQALRDSANSKLSALGLTPEEIAAITG
tara:strand:+ start:235 stop:465 length:231 start_codon:yes stop_codon:yes gene_type:complete